MKPYGRRAPIRSHGHGSDCPICKPRDDVSARRARREAAAHVRASLRDERPDDEPDSA